MKEEWKSIRGYEGYYEISSCGNIRSLDRLVQVGNHLQRVRGRIMKPCLCRSTGYYMTLLSKEGYKKRFTIHRLMALSFIPNPQNKPFIDHINGVRSDNRLENLRWCTNRENLTFPIATKNRILCQKSIRVAQIDKNTGEVINVYLSIRDIERKHGFFQSNIWKCCHNIKPSMYGYKWKYITEDEYRNYQNKFKSSSILTD